MLPVKLTDSPMGVPESRVCISNFHGSPIFFVEPVLDFDWGAFPILKDGFKRTGFVVHREVACTTPAVDRQHPPVGILACLRGSSIPMQRPLFWGPNHGTIPVSESRCHN